MAESDALLESQIKNRRTNSTALGYKGQISGHRHLGRKTGVEVRTGPNDAQAVRPHDTKPAGMSYPLNLFFYLSALVTDLLPPPRRNDNGAIDFFSTHSFTISTTL